MGHEIHGAATQTDFCFHNDLVQKTSDSMYSLVGAQYWDLQVHIKVNYDIPINATILLHGLTHPKYYNTLGVVQEFHCRSQRYVVHAKNRRLCIRVQPNTCMSPAVCPCCMGEITSGGCYVCG